MTMATRSASVLVPAALLAALTSCSSDYSPNTYASNAVQQANKVEPGLIVGFREVQISANGTVGAVSGGAAGGILGAQAGVTPLQNALGGVTGTAVGALVGSAVEHATTDTTGWEYIVRKRNGDLLSVTQREDKPLSLGQKVLVITGTQARVIPDYSVDLPGAPKPEHKDDAAKTETKPPPPQAPIVIITTSPGAGGLPTHVTVTNPNGGAPTVIPLPANLGPALTAHAPLAAIAAPLANQNPPAPPTEPAKAEDAPPAEAAAATETPAPPEKPTEPAAAAPTEPVAAAPTTPDTPKAPETGVSP